MFGRALHLVVSFHAFFVLPLSKLQLFVLAVRLGALLFDLLGKVGFFFFHLEAILFLLLAGLTPQLKVKKSRVNFSNDVLPFELCFRVFNYVLLELTCDVKVAIVLV